MGESAPLHPACVQCSTAWAKKHALPAIVPVERALIMRRTDLAYIAIVECHGAKAIVEFGQETPSDNRIRTARAFA